MEMPKLKINERTVEALQLEIDQCKKEKQQIQHENDSLRQENGMFAEILIEMTGDDSYWNDDPQTQTMRWRVKNMVNNRTLK